MATVTGLTADRMLAIEAASVVDGSIVGDNLILEKHDGTTIDAGNVRGPIGPSGVIDSIANGDTTNAPSRNAVFDALALKAPLDSPVFTGIPGAPTQAPGTSDLSLANTAFVSTSIAARRIVAASKVQAWGHSYMAGVTPDGDGYAHPGMAQQIADDQTLSLEQHAVGGTVLYRHISAGAEWSKLFQNVKRPSGFTELGGFYPLMYGMNDMSLLGGTALLLRPFLESLKACVSRVRAGGWFHSNHASVALGGSGAWTNVPDVAYVGDHVAFNPTSGATVTVTTPAEMPAGFMTAMFMTWSESGGTTWTGSDKAAGYSVDTNTVSRTDAYIPVALRIPTTGGAGTYVFATSATTGSVGAIFLGWLWEPLGDSGPLVALVEQPKPIDYSGYAGSPFVPTDAAVDIMNAEIVSLGSAFGSPRVVSVDASVMDKSVTYFIAGNVHCNQAGHDKLADLVTKKVTETSTIMHFPLDVPNLGTGTITNQWKAYTPVLSGSGSALGNGTITGAYVEQVDGTVHWYARLDLGSTTTIGNVFISLPPVAPLSDVALSALSVLGVDQGTANYTLAGYLNASAGTVTIFKIGTDGIMAPISATVPFTWTSTDAIVARGTYRKAT